MRLLKRLNLKTIISELPILIGLGAVILVLSFLSPHFLTASNIFNVLRQVSVIGFIACGMTFIITAGEIDLSVGSIVALTGTFVAGPMLYWGWPLLPSILLALLVGAGIGCFTGSTVVSLRMPSFVVTLGMMSLLRGTALVYTDGYPAVIESPFLRSLGRGYLGPVPYSVFLFLGIFLLCLFIFHRTRFGRHVVAVGGNREAARLAGIHVTAIRISVFCLGGLLSAVSGIVLAGQLSSGTPNAGQQFELEAIAAVVLGGTNLYGGEGKMFGTLLGVLIIGFINNGLNLLNVSPYYQMIVKGAVILIAVGLNRFHGRMSS